MSLKLVKLIAGSRPKVGRVGIFPLRMPRSLMWYEVIDDVSRSIITHSYRHMPWWRDVVQAVSDVSCSMLTILGHEGPRLTGSICAAGRSRTKKTKTMV